MFRFFPLVFIVQAFCVYHAYKTKAEQKWYWLILFFPLIGCGIYLYHHFYNRQNLAKVAEGIKTTVDSSYTTTKLEKELDFADTMDNKMALGDHYVKIDRIPEAVQLYESCLEGFNHDNIDVLKRVVVACYMNEDYLTAIKYGDKANQDKEFFKSEEKSAYAWSLYETGEIERAEKCFQDMNISFTNYSQRVEYGKLLQKEGRFEDAKKLLTEMAQEYNQMEPREQKMNKPLAREIQQMLSVTG
jgi:hypothetical protein